MVEPSPEWRFVGDYAIWTGNRLSMTELYRLYEQRGRKVLPVPPSSARAIMHPISGQTWFHIERLFGFWMKADVDTVWIDAPGKDGHYYTLVVGGAETRPGSISTGWLCPSCGIVFNTRDYDVTKRRFQSFLDDMKLRVAEFNSQESKRVCPDCKAMHRTSYGFLQAGSYSA